MTAVEETRQRGNPQALVGLIPYAAGLGLAINVDDYGPVFALPFAEHHVGNPMLPALHGGLIGGFMENAAILALLWRRETTELPRVVDFSIDYLRPGGPQRTFARCEIRRQGRRVANVGITAWQGGRGAHDRPIATARAHFLVGDGLQVKGD